MDFLQNAIQTLPVWLQMILQLALLAVGFVLLIKGADFFVDGASAVAERFGIPQIVIGLTIVAMGTSLPEAAVSIASASKGNADIAIGNILGSNIMNVLVILGLTAIIRALPVGKNTARYEMPFVIGMTLLLFGLGWFDGKVARADGVILWLFFIAYLAYLWKETKKSQEKGETAGEEEGGEKKPLSIPMSLLLIVLGAGMIVIGSDVAVDAASAIARQLGVTERVIGLTIVALGTSLPELVTSVTAARRGKTDIAVGNIVGSNIFNILFVIGSASLITQVPYQQGFLVDSIICIATAVLLLVCALPKKLLGRKSGCVMLLGYAAYFVYLIKG